MTFLCDKFGKEKLRNGACSWEAQQLEGHKGWGLGSYRRASSRGPTSKQRKLAGGKRGKERGREYA